MGNKELLDFSKDLDRTLGTAEDAPDSSKQPLNQPETSLTFAEAIQALIDDALRLSYSRKEITLVLGDAIGRLGHIEDRAPDAWPR